MVEHSILIETTAIMQGCLSCQIWGMEQRRLEEEREVENFGEQVPVSRDRCVRSCSLPRTHSPLSPVSLFISAFVNICVL